MLPEARREAADWLARAGQDIEAAETLLAREPPLLVPVAYHAQQAAEMALKGYLAANNQPAQRTHNLNVVLPPCVSIQPEFHQFASTARILTPLATEFRYPPGPLAPTRPDAEQALQLARDLVAFIRRQLGV